MKYEYYGRERICRSFIDTKINGKTLNIGSGEMLWIENDLFPGNPNFISSDINKRNLGKHNLAINKIVANAENLPLKNNELSQLIILDVLEHIKNDEKVIREIHRVLNSNGKLVICVPNDTLLSFINPIRYAQHERHYTIKQITSLLKKNGFAIEKVHAGGRILDLVDLYSHLIIKYTTGKKIKLSFLNGLRDKEYSNHINNGNEITVLARKI